MNDDAQFYADCSRERIETNPPGSQIFALLAIAAAIDKLADAASTHNEFQLRERDGGY